MDQGALLTKQSGHASVNLASSRVQFRIESGVKIESKFNLQIASKKGK